MISTFGVFDGGGGGAVVGGGGGAVVGGGGWVVGGICVSVVVIDGLIDTSGVSSRVLNGVNCGVSSTMTELESCPKIVTNVTAYGPFSPDPLIPLACMLYFPGSDGVHSYRRDSSRFPSVVWDATFSPFTKNSIC